MGQGVEIERIIEGLSRPEAYAHPVDEVRVIHTHISVVFLAGSFAYKVKKPLDLGFLDFTSFERRRHFCHEEVRLNRRLAPDVYLGVVALTLGGHGDEGEGVEGEAAPPDPGAGESVGLVEVGGLVAADAVDPPGEGEPTGVRRGAVVDHAVKMTRLPAEATLEARLDRDELPPESLEALGRRVAGFHMDAASGPEISRFAEWEVVAGNARDNLTQAAAQVGTAALSSAVHDRLEGALERRSVELRPLIERRARSGRPRDTHGDLHLDHVYLFTDRTPPSDLVVIDCIEFSERFRYADPVSDMAFLAMDLLRHGRPDLEAGFSRAYFEAADDPDGAALLPFYRSYRAAVRGKVEGMKTGKEVPAEERGRAVRAARGHWLLALSELEEPERRPGLVLVGGLPGSGKSTIAEGLARTEGFELVSSDRTRKELAGVDAGTGAAADFGEGIYTPDWTRRTYEACLDRVRRSLFEGGRVLVDATFRDEGRRRMFLDVAREHGVRATFLLCEADPAVIRARIAAPRTGGSDADWTIYQEVSRRWEAPSPRTERSLRNVGTEADPEQALREARAHLARAGLVRSEAISRREALRNGEGGEDARASGDEGRR